MFVPAVVRSFVTVVPYGSFVTVVRLLSHSVARSFRKKVVRSLARSLQSFVRYSCLFARSSLQSFVSLSHSVAHSLQSFVLYSRSFARSSLRSFARSFVTVFRSLASSFICLFAHQWAIISIMYRVEHRGVYRGNQYPTLKNQPRV